MLYLIKNLIIIIFGLFFSYLLLNLHIYFQLTNIEINDFYLHFFQKDFYNVLILLLIYIFIYYILSLINYLISSYSFTNYYSFIVALIISALHSYILLINDISIDIVSYISLTSIEIFLSYFINYSTKYENSNKILP
ncbi:MAG: hypothetical protein MR270_02925 [Erysipelotrichaceae bacterium]|nr:hypothetical protein [Erysipelotrichaceae bacterium]